MTSLQGSTLPYLIDILIYVKLSNLWRYIAFHFSLMSLNERYNQYVMIRLANERQKVPTMELHSGTLYPL